MAFNDLEDHLDPPPTPTISRLKCDKVRFNIDSCVPHPDCAAVLRAVYQICHDKPDLALLVASHTDTQGDEAKNQKLSDARSKSIVLLLTEDPEKWADHVVSWRTTQSKTHLAKDVDDVIGYFAKLEKWHGCAPGNQGRIKRFKDRCDTKYEDIKFTKTTEDVDHDLWLCVALCFHHYIKDQLGLTFLSDLNEEYVKKITWLDPEHPYVGCGERRLLKDTGNNKDEPDNRRTEFLFFPKEGRPVKTDEEPETPELPPPWLEALADPKRAHFEPIECPCVTWFGKCVPHGNIIFVIDCSGSMNAQMGATGRTRLEVCQAQLVSCLLNLDDTDRFTVVAYSSNCDPTDPEDPEPDPKKKRRIHVDAVRAVWTDAPPTTADKGQLLAAKPLLKNATDPNVDEAVAWVNKQFPAGVTFTGPALAAGFRSTGLLPSPDADGKTVPITVLLLTDGAPTNTTPQREAADPNKTGKPERDAILTSITTWNKQGWPLSIIGFLNPASSTDKEFDKFLKDLHAKSPVATGQEKGTYEVWTPKTKPVKAKK